MSPHLQEIRDQQKASWNKFSPGWKKWNEITMDFLKPMGDEIIHSLNPKGNEEVLDIAGGTGEPGLTIASMLPGGKVTIADISEDMLEIARENALKREINNVETLVCDVCELPFDDDSFDTISCRFGFMFFPDMLIAIKELVRVMRPGGKIATSVWNVPDKNFWITAMGGTINRNMQLPATQPGAPGMFRCSESGLIEDLFLQAGLINTSEKEIAGKLKCGTADAYWNMMTEVAAPFVSALNNANDALKEKIKEEVIQAVNQRYPNGNVHFDSSALVIYGEKLS